MSTVTKDFETFCANLRMSNNVVENVQYRYHQITRRINLDFWRLDNNSYHSFYVGSYGRSTAIFTSDIDVVVVLPYEIYAQYNAYSNNGQSALLQAVSNSLKKTYSTSSVGGDGQVVVINFSDDIRFEIVPAFENTDGSYTYPDSNNGGTWKTMDPKTEMNAFNTLNSECNKNLKRLCRMARAWNDKNNVFMKGMLIDTLAYRFMKDYEYNDKSYTYYDWMSRDFMQYLIDQADKAYWCAPGTNWHVTKDYSFKREATAGHTLCEEAISADSKDFTYTAHEKWRTHYGTKFPTA